MSFYINNLKISKTLLKTSVQLLSQNNHVLNRGVHVSALKFQSENNSGSNSSTDNTANASTTEKVETVEERILRNALKFVPVCGFSIESLRRSSIDLGYSDATAGMFKNGAFDLIDFFYKDSNEKVSEYLQNLLKERDRKIGVPELIRSGIVYRLTLIQPYIQKWPEAMAIMSFNPNYAVDSIKNLLDLCDEMWYVSGDKSTDFNWYTKRLSLATIYKTTELFMIQDTSDNYTETWKFLDRRFEDLRSFASLTKSVNECNQLLSGSFKVVRNILNIR